MRGISLSAWNVEIRSGMAAQTRSSVVMNAGQGTIMTKQERAGPPKGGS